MPRRRWDATTQALRVREGLQGKPFAEMCPAHQLSQAPYAQWRDPCLAHAAKAFEVHAKRQREARLAREHAKRKPLVGALTLE